MIKARNDKNEKVIRVAIIGNPNSGKSTLFNALTGLRQKTGNFPGVTVEKKTGTIKLCEPATGTWSSFEITDLPGTYSLYPKSLDEQIAFKVITDANDMDYPDITLVVLDASNLKRNLLLASQVIDLSRPVLIVLTMGDIATSMGYEIDTEKLEEKLGVPVVSVNSLKKQGMESLKQNLFRARTSVFFPSDKYKNTVDLLPARTIHAASHFGALLKHIVLSSAESKENLSNDFGRFEYRDNLDRFKEINLIWTSCVIIKEIPVKKSISDRIDDVLTHRFFGPLFFLLVLFAIFQSVFYLAELPMAIIESGFSSVSHWLKDALPAGKLSGLVTDGIISGLSGIVVFVPQIALLFGFLAVLEDSGYMARVTVIMDKLMRGIGLNGRSVIPLISGAACAVPAIMGTRTIPNWRERLITIMITPLISCSARLPVFTLLISLMVPEEESVGFFSSRGLWLLGLYLMGFFASVLVALVMKLLVKAREKSYFIMELPVYRSPQLRTVLLTMMNKVRVFLWDAGKVIMIISIALWLLKSFGPNPDYKRYETLLEQNELTLGRTPKTLNETETLNTEKRDLNAKLLESSYAGHLGRFIEPAIKPLGFDWKIGISLITSFAAREVFVGTMATIYSSTEEEMTLRNKIAEQKNPLNGKKIYDKATCVSLLLFYVFAMQCMSTMAVVRRETKSWKWPLIQFFYMGAMAWAASFTAYSLLS